MLKDLITSFAYAVINFTKVVVDRLGLSRDEEYLQKFVNIRNGAKANHIWTSILVSSVRLKLSKGNSKPICNIPNVDKNLFANEQNLNEEFDHLSDSQTNQRAKVDKRAASEPATKLEISKQAEARAQV